MKGHTLLKDINQMHLLQIYIDAILGIVFLKWQLIFQVNAEAPAAHLV